MRLYIYAFLVLAFLGVLYGAVQYGRSMERDKVTQAVNNLRNEEAKLITDLQDAKLKREIVYRDRVKVVREIEDSTGCLDTPFPIDVLNSLRNDVYTR